MKFRTQSLSAFLALYGALLLMVLFPVISLVVLAIGVYGLSNIWVRSRFQSDGSILATEYRIDESTSHATACKPALDYVDHCAAG